MRLVGILLALFLLESALAADVGRFWQFADPHIDYFYAKGSSSYDYCHSAKDSRFFAGKEGFEVSEYKKADEYDGWCEAKTDDLCGICESIVCLFQTKIEGSLNETEIIEKMLGVCKDLKDPVLVTACDGVVLKYGESISVVLDALDPLTICRTIDACSKGAGAIADYYCSPSGDFLQNALDFMKSVLSEPDFVVLNGDFAPQTPDPKVNSAFLIESIANVTRAYSKTFPNAVSITTIGNHDCFPMNDFEIGGGDLLRNLTRVWAGLIPEKEMKTFGQNGYYSISAGKMMRLVSLNTNLWSTENKHVDPVRENDPGGQFAWLESELKNASATGQKVLIVGHIPPGKDERLFDVAPMFYFKRYSEEYRRITIEHSKTIVGHLFGHEHSDAFRLMYNYKKEPISTMYIAPAITPKKCGLDLHKKPFDFGPIGVGNNPSVRLWEYDRETGELLDYVQYFLPLSVANFKGKAEWKIEYSARKDFDMQDLSPVEWDKLLGKWSTDDKLFQEYFHYLSSNITLPYCPEAGRIALSCAASYITEDEFDLCISDISGTLKIDSMALVLTDNPDEVMEVDGHGIMGMEGLWNEIRTIADADKVFEFDKAEYDKLLQSKPWAGEHQYFKNVNISALALLKMVLHADSGDDNEIMGMLQGKVDGDTFIILDAIPLPVTGTETRVSAHEECDKYIINYNDALKEVGRNEYLIGWYHSHPGYGCWLSGIDVTTQKENQMFQDPWVAVVVDPKRLLAGGKVEVGAFRTYPTDFKPLREHTMYQSIPINRIEEYGVHANNYYPLSVSFFKSLSDSKLLGSLWNDYWVSVLSSSPLVKNTSYSAKQSEDLSAKIDSMRPGRSQRYFSSRRTMRTEGQTKDLKKLSRDSAKAAMETCYGVMNEVLKDGLFNTY